MKNYIPIPENCDECIFNYDTIECRIYNEYPDKNTDGTRIESSKKPDYCKLEKIKLIEKGEQK